MRVAVAVLFVAAFTQLIVHLARSFRAIREMPAENLRGFEPIMTATQVSPGEGNECPRLYGRTRKGGWGCGLAKVGFDL